VSKSLHDLSLKYLKVNHTKWCAWLFDTLCVCYSLQHFDENELEWLIGGLPTIDTDDWCVF
jgi:hypothetical protein